MLSSRQRPVPFTRCAHSGWLPFISSAEVNNLNTIAFLKHPITCIRAVPRLEGLETKLLTLKGPVRALIRLSLALPGEPSNAGIWLSLTLPHESWLCHCCLFPLGWLSAEEERMDGRCARTFIFFCSVLGALEGRVQPVAGITPAGSGQRVQISPLWFSQFTLFHCFITDVHLPSSAVTVPPASLSCRAQAEAAHEPLSAFLSLDSADV